MIRYLTTRTPFIFIALLLGAFTLLFSACTDKQTATRLLEDQGLESITITGYSWFACSKDDWYHTGFVALNHGRTVTGVVCEGIFKASTVRYF